MYKDYKISLIIPVHNEERGLKKIFSSNLSLVDEIILINTLSTDKTVEIGQKAGAKVINENQKGYGRAYKTGFRYATGDIIITMDADAQYPIGEIKNIIEFMLEKNLDFIFTSRFPLKNKKSMPLMRIIGNKFLTFIFNFLFKTNIKDSQSGMWVFKRDILEKINLMSNGMSFSEEIKLKVILNREIKFKQYHIDYFPREGKSKLLPFKSGIDNIIFLVKNYFGYKNEKYF